MHNAVQDVIEYIFRENNYKILKYDSYENVADYVSQSYNEIRFVEINM